MNAHQRRIARRRHKWSADIPKAFLPRDGPKVLKVISPPPAVNDNKPLKSVGIHTHKLTSAAAFGAALEKRGFKKLGSGAYSTVYGKDGYDKVIKVTRCLDNWIDYVAWASKNGYAGNFAPKVFSWKRMAHPSAKKSEDPFGGTLCYDWSIAVVERMKETLNSDSQLAADFKIIERIHDLSTRSVLAELVMDEIVPGVGKFFKDLHKNFHASDIYGKNIMIRHDGTFCVTDPVCGTVRTDAVRLKAGDFSPVVNLYWRYFESSS